MLSILPENAKRQTGVKLMFKSNSCVKLAGAGSTHYRHAVVRLWYVQRKMQIHLRQLSDFSDFSCVHAGACNVCYILQLMSINYECWEVCLVFLKPLQFFTVMTWRWIKQCNRLKTWSSQIGFSCPVTSNKMTMKLHLNQMKLTKADTCFF